MSCPFPGMDPYLERPEIWPDFHDSLIAYIREWLQPLLRPKYAALTQDRLYVVEHSRPIRPDVSVVRTWEPTESRSGGAAVAIEPDTPLVVEIAREEIRQPVIHIVEPAANRRIVTAIEVLSPDNKTPGAGRNNYLEKKGELLDGGANLVEIDLLREGRRTFDPPSDLEPPAAWHYIAVVTRANPSRQEFYACQLQKRLPRVAVPLAAGDRDVVLDVQAVFARCWETGPYPELLGYDDAPPGELDDDHRTWCRQVLASSG